MSEERVSHATGIPRLQPRGGSQARIPIILSVQLVPDREQWSAWAELDILSSKYTGMPWVRMGIWESTSRERPQVVAI